GGINLYAGSFGYKKASTPNSGGNDFVKALLSASTEKGDQYKDGNGDTFLQQHIKRGVPKVQQNTTKDLDGLEKKSVISNLQFNLTN
ncbi:TonB-dependent receptor, partial [Aliarcobacter butzleri]